MIFPVVSEALFERVLAPKNREIRETGRESVGREDTNSLHSIIILSIMVSYNYIALCFNKHRGHNS